MLGFSLEPVESDAVIPRTLREASEAVIIISVVFMSPVVFGVQRRVRGLEIVEILVVEVAMGVVFRAASVVSAFTAPSVDSSVS